MNNTKLNYTINKNLEDLNFKISNLWTEWSSCSKCDEIGKQIKFGHCFVSLKSTSTKYKHFIMKNIYNDLIYFIICLIIFNYIKNK